MREFERHPLNACGGILADEMGFGKTLQTLALIVSTRREAHDFVSRSVPAHLPRRTSATLVVCPAGVIQAWRDSIEKHFQPNTLRCYSYRGADRKTNTALANFNDYDIVLTSYKNVADDLDAYSRDRGTGRGHHPLFMAEFFRVVFDEVHVCRNPATGLHKAANALKGRRRWGITGTPLQNELQDLHALFAILHIHPLGDMKGFQRLIQDKIQAAGASSTTIPSAITATVLRRTRDEFPLAVKKIILDTWISPAQHPEFNKQLQLAAAAARNAVGSVAGASTTMRMISHVDIIRRFLSGGEGVLRPDHRGQLLSTAFDQFQALRSHQTTRCSFCGRAHMEEGDDLIDTDADGQGAVMTHISRPCNHVCCATCWEPGVRTCAACSFEVVEQIDQIDQAGAIPSPKVETAVGLVQDFLTCNHKTVVFSQWTRVLRVVEHHFGLHDIHCDVLHGGLSDARRTALQQRFIGGDLPVLLCTTGAGGVGINLVPGCRVILMDESWNPAVDAQAIDRVYREPQTRDVRVYKLLLRGTMDERVRLFQSKKQTIAALALGGYSGNPRTANELRLLLGLPVSSNGQASASYGVSTQGQYDDLVV